MHIERLITEDQAILVSGEKTLEGVLRHLARVGHALLPDHDEEALYKHLIERERQYPTCTPEGVAFPHAMVRGIDRTVPIVARLVPPVDFRSGSHPSVSLAFGLFSSVEKPFEHVRVLARLARIARAPGALERLNACSNSRALFEQTIAEDRSHE